MSFPSWRPRTTPVRHRTPRGSRYGAETDISGGLGPPPRKTCPCYSFQTGGKINSAVTVVVGPDVQAHVTPCSPSFALDRRTVKNAASSPARADERWGPPPSGSDTDERKDLRMSAARHWQTAIVGGRRSPLPRRSVGVSTQF